MRKILFLLVLIVILSGGCNNHKLIRNGYTSASSDSIPYYDSLCTKAFSFTHNCKNDSSQKYLSLVFRFLKKEPNSEQTDQIYSKAYDVMGRNYALKSKHDSALIYYKIAYEKGIKYKSKNSIMTCINILTNIANNYLGKGDYTKASFTYRKAMFLCDSLSIKNKDLITNIYVGLGQTYMDLRNYTLCDHYFNLANQGIGHMETYPKFLFYNARCNSYYFRKNYTEAYKYAWLALQAAKTKTSLLYEQNVAKANLGELSVFLKRYDDADRFLNEAYTFFKSTKNETGMYMEETQLMKLALKQHDNAKAEKYYILSTKHDLKLVDTNSIIIHNDALQNYYKSINNYKEAYKYLSKNIKLNDSVRSTIVRNNVAEIDMRYSQDVKVMKKEMQLKDQKNKIKQLRLFTIIIILLLIMVIASIIIYVRQKAKKNSIILQQRTNELKSLRLMNIRNCLSPHFTFNVLNHEISNEKGDIDMMRNDLLELSKLMRKTIEFADKLSIPLKEELDFIHSYLDIANTCFNKDDFSGIIKIDDNINPDQIFIPSMIIYQSVENALKHGLSGIERHKDLLVNIKRINAGTEITILDNGRGYHPENYIVTKGTGTGQKAMRRTVDFLNLYNKEKIKYTIRNRTDKESTGTIVIIYIPDNYSYRIL